LNDALGLLLLVIYIVAIVGLAAAVTYAVIRIFPTERSPKKPDTSETPSSGGTSTGGSLFRKSKSRTT